MKRSVFQTLILTDWYRHWPFVLITIVCGALALALLQVKGDVAFVLGSTCFFVALIVFGCILPFSNVINERKKQTLPFLMSLPVSVAQYTAAKTISTVGMFLVPWLLLVAGGLTFIATRQGIPNGIIPMVLILMVLPLVGFCLIAGVAMVSESEGWATASMVFCNTSYSFGWFLLVRNPAIRADMQSPVAVWSPAVLQILGGEIAVIAVILGLTFYLQSRKRDFI